MGDILELIGPSAVCNSFEINNKLFEPQHFLVDAPNSILSIEALKSEADQISAEQVPLEGDHASDFIPLQTPAKCSI